MRFLNGFLGLAQASQIPLPEWTDPTINNIALNSSSTLQNRLENALAHIEKIQQIGGTVGMSIGVMSQGEVLLDHHLGFADLGCHIRANSSTIYPIASLSKAFIASTIGQLVGEGLLSWEEPIHTYIPELVFEHDASLASQLSLIDLLAHRTGLARLDTLWLGAEGQTMIPKNWTVTMCNRLRPLHPVRSKWLYNNWMYALAGEIIERVTGTSWGRVLFTRILQPLHLSHTTAIASEIPQDSLALPYLVLDNLEAVQAGEIDLTDGAIMGPAGGIRSSLSDLLKWGDALLSHFRDDGPALASFETVFGGHIFINSTSASDELYALGFAKVVTPAQFGKTGFNGALVDAMPVIGKSSKPQMVFYHSGGLPGYNHCFMLIPELQTVIAVLTNSLGKGDIPDWVGQTLLQVVLGEKHPVDLLPLARKAATVWRGSHQRLVDTLEADRRLDSEEPARELLLGSYSHASGALYLEVFEEEGKLKFHFNGEERQRHTLSHYSGDTFSFLPFSSEERLRRGLFHYGASAWLLDFRSQESGKFGEVRWRADADLADGEVFVRV